MFIYFFFLIFINEMVLKMCVIRVYFSIFFFNIFFTFFFTTFLLIFLTLIWVDSLLFGFFMPWQPREKKKFWKFLQHQHLTHLGACFAFLIYRRRFYEKGVPSAKKKIVFKFTLTCKKNVKRRAKKIMRKLWNIKRKLFLF